MRACLSRFGSHRSSVRFFWSRQRAHVDDAPLSHRLGFTPFDRTPALQQTTRMLCPCHSRSASQYFAVQTCHSRSVSHHFVVLPYRNRQHARTRMPLPLHSRYVHNCLPYTPVTADSVRSCACCAPVTADMFCTVLQYAGSQQTARARTCMLRPTTVDMFNTILPYARVAADSVLT